VDQNAGDLDEYVYTRTDLWRDYVRALLGLAICVAPFIWLEPALYFIVVLLAMGAVFAVLLWQTMARQFTRVLIDAQGITMIAFRRRTIAWDQLRQMQLSYFTTWKNLQGFMELKLKGPGVSMKVGSSLIGFRNVAKAASEAAFRNRLTFKAATIENLKHLNIVDPRLDPDEEDGED
jgi:hypothetical protein